MHVSMLLQGVTSRFYKNSLEIRSTSDQMGGWIEGSRGLRGFGDSGFRVGSFGL